MPEWISVEDRLPDKDGLYLVWVLFPYNEHPEYSIVNYDYCAEEFGEWNEEFDPVTFGRVGCEFVSVENITHWMPLPEPPKEDPE